MNIRIPVPKSSGSELFDDECRSHTSRAVRYRTVPVPVPYRYRYLPYVLTRVIQDAQSRKSLARARVARARHRAEIPDPVNEFSGRFPENSRAAREFSSGWRKSTDANSRACARARHARDRVCTGILYDSDHPESGTLHLPTLLQNLV